jgi:3-oxoacyl-[acyl-carrier-protein] synthase-3
MDQAAGRGDDPNRGVLYSTMGSDGGGWSALNCQAYGSRHPATKPLDDPQKLYMSINGKEIYQRAVRTIVELVEDSLKQCSLDTSDLKLLIPHQMNARIIESAAKRLKLPDEKVFINIAQYGNTSAASIPIALDECMRAKRLQPGDVIVFVAFGAGLTWGANVIRV